MKKILSLCALLTILIAISCKNAPETNQPVTTEEKVIDKSGSEYTSEYICPMHCKGSGSESTGECPICGMDYVINKDIDHSGHDHDHHHGHGHDHHHH